MLQETQLVTDLKERKKNAFEELYCNYSKALYTVLYSMLKDHSVCEDVLQDVFLKIWNYIDRYNAGKGTLFTWMASIAKNAARDTIGSSWFKNRKKTEPLTAITEVYQTNNNLNNYLPVKQIVDHLGKKQQMIILLSFYYGYSQAEIAELTNIPIGTIKTWNRKALQMMKTRITRAKQASSVKFILS